MSDSFNQYDLLPASFRYEERTRNREVFIVTRNTGIFGCFTGQADADRLAKEINDNPEKWGLVEGDFAKVVTIQQNKVYDSAK